MKKIAIIGASGLAKEVWDLINVINETKQKWNVMGFYDDAFDKPTKIIGETICLGPIDLLLEEEEELSLVFGIANREVVSKLVKRFSSKENFSYPNLMHPNIEKGFNFKTGVGNIVATQTIFTTDITIGNFNFFDTNCAVGHDVVIGSYNCFMPRVQISGNVRIGNGNNFLMSSMIVQDKTIGDKNTIFASTLLTKSIKDNRTYFGIPGKKIPNL